MIALLLAITIGIHISDVFAPPPKPDITRWSPVATADVQKIELGGGDGTKLRGWLIPTARKDAPYGDGERGSGLSRIS